MYFYTKKNKESTKGVQITKYQVYKTNTYYQAAIIQTNLNRHIKENAEINNDALLAHKGWRASLTMATIILKISTF